MKSDLEKSKDELVQELSYLRRSAAEADELRRRLEAAQNSCDQLKRSYETRTEEFNRECSVRDETEEALRLAEVIVDRSPVILFRRKAGDKPRLEYVSENIRQMGYSAEQFLSGELAFRDVVHPDEEVRRVLQAFDRRPLVGRVQQADRVGRPEVRREEGQFLHPADGYLYAHRGSFLSPRRVSKAIGQATSP